MDLATSTSTSMDSSSSAAAPAPSPSTTAVPMTPPPVPLELKQHGRSANKSLKHKSKSKRALATDLGASDADGSSSAVPGPSSAAAGSDSARSHHHHHHHAHRHSRSGSNGAAPPSAATSEDAMRELLTSKIAEIQVGGDENLEAPIDVSGIYQDETLAARTVAAMMSVVADPSLTGDAKVDALATQVTKISEDLTQLQHKIGEMNAKCILLKQRKATATTELGKSNAAKAKLELLCRELQKQNKLSVSESRRIADEEAQRRRELSTRFQKTIEEVSVKMEQQSKDYVESLRENDNLKQKLKTFLEQYTVREEHFAKQLEAKDLTVQLAEARLAHQVELTAREAERVKLALAKAQEFSERETQLQLQLSAYSEKFDVVQETLSKSHSMFATFREEMDKMAKKTKALEKENAAMKKKCQAYDSSAIAAVQEKVRAAEDAQRQLEKIKKLESLCRQLQAERNSIRESSDSKQRAPESA